MLHQLQPYLSSNTSCSSRNEYRLAATTTRPTTIASKHKVGRIRNQTKCTENKMRMIFFGFWFLLIASLGNRQPRKKKTALRYISCGTTIVHLTNRIMRRQSNVWCFVSCGPTLYLTSSRKQRLGYATTCFHQSHRCRYYGKSPTGAKYCYASGILPEETKVRSRLPPIKGSEDDIKSTSTKKEFSVVAWLERGAWIGLAVLILVELYVHLVVFKDWLPKSSS